MPASRAPEQLIIRPPSEAGSVLVRVVRGCAWNRCRFCGIYPFFGQPEFSVRSAEEVKRDVEVLKATFPGARSAFMGDADPMLVPEEEGLEIVRAIREAWPRLERLTCYARATTLWKKGPEFLKRLAAAGLTRVHVGLESGDLETLRIHRKGQNPRVLVESGRWVREAGIQLSFYVLLGLGGRDRWREHVDGTAEVINAVSPEFVRVRRLWLYRGEEGGGGPDCPLWEDIEAGRFEPQTPEGTVRELRRLLAGMERVSSLFTCDHANNYVRVEGRLMAKRDAMLAVVDEFLELPPEERRLRYDLVGSRL
ncbi:MAG: B12-binding domain-containing radical SAM protein [Planctomycetota bacterium]|jgi:hypothetical protein